VTNDRSEPESGGSHAREAYIHRDDSVMTVKQHAARTADKQASWFLPYLKPGMTLLDCGCASGSITIGLAKAVAPGSATGVDVSEVEIERAKARAEQEGAGNVRFVVGSVYELDFEDSSLDAVFGHNVLEHLSEPRRAVQEMHRVLKPGGVIGLRNFDIGGVLFAPELYMMKRFLSMYETDWKTLNGHPRMGRYLVEQLTQGGFVEIEASASYEAYSGPEGREFVKDVLVGGPLTDVEWIGRVVGLGLATQEEIQAMYEELLAWHELPGAFFATAHVEIVGRKT
jgi:ubiquinone/menaquinone biosynthesis C-methylase UbiE